jgi:ribonuclease Y
MEQIIFLLVIIITLFLGILLGYQARQFIGKKRIGTIEEKIQKLKDQAKKEADQILERAKKEEDQRRRELAKAHHFLLKRESNLEQKLSALQKREKEFSQKVLKLKSIKEELENLRKEALENLERISGFSKEQAKEEILANLEKEYQKEILERMKKLEREGWERWQKRAKELLSLAIQKCAVSQVQETTSSIVNLPSDEIKGRIIGKEGRNIRTLERLTGTEIIIDETPDIVVVSGYDPIRRQIAKISLEKLIQDGRIQPARIEEIVAKTSEEIKSEMREAGERALYETGVIGLNPKLVQLLGRLHFRTSYGQNVLLHSIEVSHLASALASEIGANSQICKKAGLLHDIGKTIDQQIEGSHTLIGMKILEKYGIEKEVIDAMKSHHEEYPYESLEAILVQVADQISGARPGARKDTLENYLKRLENLENLALSFPGVEKAWALQAGREIRVFVRPEEIDDLQAKKLAKEIASRIEEELKYPGEIKVNVIRELRIEEYAK